MIRLVHLNKSYPSPSGSVVALEDVDLTIEDGAIYGIIGLSGAGKSTLVRCINLLETPTSGQVIVDGEDLTKVKTKRLHEIRRNIGMIFQSFNLLEQRTVEENVRFPLELARFKREEARSRAEELLSLVGLSEKAKAYPSQLSGGQKQRVAIARALALRPKYLLCDEATSALDPSNTASVLQLLKEINRTLGVTVVVITHEMRVVESICTDVAVLDNSRVAESGRVADVFSFPKSDIAKRLVLPDLIRTVEGAGGKKLRLVFRGEEAGAPVISGLALDCGVAVNILYADTKEIGGKTYGHMVITLPADGDGAQRARAYLKQRNVVYEEEAS